MPRESRFGVPIGAVMQVAHLVDDLEKAAHVWTQTLGVGPWTILEHFPATNMRYYGEPTACDLSLAMCYSGDRKSACRERVFLTV